MTIDKHPLIYSSNNILSQYFRRFNFVLKNANNILNLNHILSSLSIPTIALKHIPRDWDNKVQQQLLHYGKYIQNVCRNFKPNWNDFIRNEHQGNSRGQYHEAAQDIVVIVCSGVLKFGVCWRWFLYFCDGKWFELWCYSKLCESCGGAIFYYGWYGYG